MIFITDMICARRFIEDACCPDEDFSSKVERLSLKVCFCQLLVML